MANSQIKHVVSGYFDESGKLNDELVAFGGIVGEVIACNKLSQKWNARLHEEGLEYTSMKDAINWQGLYAKWSDMPERRGDGNPGQYTQTQFPSERS